MFMQNKKTGWTRFVCLVLMTGLEPARDFSRGILSPLRLPIPPHQRVLIMNFLEAPPRLELGMKVLQTSALPLGYGAIKTFINLKRLNYNSIKVFSCQQKQLKFSRILFFYSVQILESNRRFL